MYFLYWDSEDFGKRFKRVGYPEVRAKYESLEAAVAQGDHDQKLGRHPVRVETENGEVVHRWAEE